MAKLANPFSKSERGKKAQPTRQPTIPIAPDQHQLVDEDAIATLASADESTAALPKEPRLLWKEAAEKLNDEERKVLGLQLDQPLSLTAAIDEVAQQVEKACEKYQAGGWKIKRRDERVMVDVRANAKSILKFALRSKGIVEAAVKFDPTGYSWTVISLGLQLVQNDQDRIESVFKASALLADNLHRYANIEANYRNQEIPDVRHLEDKLCSSYEAILRYSATVQLERKRSFGGRVWYSFYSLSEQPLQQMQDKMLTAANATDLWLPLIQHEYRPKESAEINQKVDEAVNKLDQILESFGTSIATINGGVQLLEAISVTMAIKEDIAQIAALFQQRVAEGLDQPAGSNMSAETDRGNIRNDDQDSPFTHEEEIDALFREVFVEFHEFDEDTRQHRRIIEQLPEMRPHRTRNQNLLRAEKIIEWVESSISQLLLVDGSWVFGRYDFNSLFVGPLLIFGDSSFESVLVLRHFCGDSPSTKTNNFRTLVQALIVQMFKQRPKSFGEKLAGLTRERASSISDLWKLFLECLRESQVDCVFIIIDSIDYLQDAHASDGSSEKETVMAHMRALVQDSKMLVKILLSRSLSLDLPDSMEEQMALMTTPNLHSREPLRRLSLAIMQDEMLLVPQTLVEIQERRCQRLTFSQLPLTYPLNSIVYTIHDGQLQAFVVSGVYGMEQQTRDMYAPLRLRVWSIDHDGKHLTKRYHEFSTSQFQGEKPVTTLKYIPAGYLRDEAEQRKRLAARGRKYSALSYKYHHKEIVKNGGSMRIVIDQESVPEEMQANFDFNGDFVIKPHEEVKPRILMVCPPTINAYNLEENIWTPVLVDKVDNVQFMDEPLRTLVMEAEIESLAISLVQSHLAQMNPNESSSEDSGENDARYVMNLYEGHKPPSQRRPGILEREKGLTLLLHGGPGTGKTFAATCIAETVKSPLLSDTIGIRDSFSVERQLSKMFQLAQRWHAILVLENANAFLTQRSRNEANSSAVTLAIRTEGLEINGRDIQNITLAAEVNLARNQNTFLKVQHIQAVLENRKEFMKYIKNLSGSDMAERAMQMQIRNDAETEEGKGP
ncbi:hypothetical protein MKX08_005935 [Trichoderma sp. CBMAI-0020]|nr:hypothetical protein MKX08_005935 [Trichoderma sp. CBMAI-0020]